MDLTLVPMDDMVTEMKKRFDTLVVLTRRQVDKDTDDICHHFQDKVGCVGIMQIAISYITSGYTNKETGTWNE